VKTLLGLSAAVCEAHIGAFFLKIVPFFQFNPSAIASQN